MDKWDELFVQDYEIWLKSQGLSASTTAFYLSQLCTFYKQAVKRGKIQEQDISPGKTRHHRQNLPSNSFPL